MKKTLNLQHDPRQAWIIKRAKIFSFLIYSSQSPSSPIRLEFVCLICGVTFIIVYWIYNILFNILRGDWRGFVLWCSTSCKCFCIHVLNSSSRFLHIFLMNIIVLRCWLLTMLLKCFLNLERWENYFHYKENYNFIKLRPWKH